MVEKLFKKNIKWGHPYPTVILLISLLEMGHPVTKRLKSVRCQLLPNDRNVTIKKGSSDLVQLAAHPHLTSQGLQHTGESKQIPIGAKHKYTTPAD